MHRSRADFAQGMRGPLQPADQELLHSSWMEGVDRASHEEPMIYSTAYRDGWLAHAGDCAEVECPYHPDLMARSRQDWLRGHRDRAGKLPGDPYLAILDAAMMRVEHHQDAIPRMITIALDDEAQVDRFARAYVDVIAGEGVYDTLPDDLKEFDRKHARMILAALARGTRTA